MQLEVAPTWYLIANRLAHSTENCKWSLQPHIKARYAIKMHAQFVVFNILFVNTGQYTFCFSQLQERTHMIHTDIPQDSHDQNIWSYGTWYIYWHCSNTSWVVLPRTVDFGHTYHRKEWLSCWLPWKKKKSLWAVLLLTKQTQYVIFKWIHNQPTRK